MWRSGREYTAAMKSPKLSRSLIFLFSFSSFFSSHRCLTYGGLGTAFCFCLCSSAGDDPYMDMLGHGVISYCFTVSMALLLYW